MVDKKKKKGYAQRQFSMGTKTFKVNDVVEVAEDVYDNLSDDNVGLVGPDVVKISKTKQAKGGVSK